MSRRSRVLFAALLFTCMATVATAAPRGDDGNGPAPSLIRMIINKLHKLLPVINDDSKSGASTSAMSSNRRNATNRMIAIDITA